MWMNRFPTSQELNRMANIDITKVNKQDLIDIRDVHIEEHHSKEEKIKSFINQVKNPYCYRCGDVVVKVSYGVNVATMQEKMESYLMSL